MITFKVIGAPCGSRWGKRISLSSESPRPLKFIGDMVLRWHKIDAACPTLVEITGLEREPIVIEADACLARDYLFRDERNARQP